MISPGTNIRFTVGTVGGNLTPVKPVADCGAVLSTWILQQITWLTLIIQRVSRLHLAMVRQDHSTITNTVNIIVGRAAVKIMVHVIMMENQLSMNITIIIIIIIIITMLVKWINILALKIHQRGWVAEFRSEVPNFSDWKQVFWGYPKVLLNKCHLKQLCTNCTFIVHVTCSLHDCW